MKDSSIETQMRQVLGKKVHLSNESELSLFSQAEELLAVRRARLTARESMSIKAMRARSHSLIKLRGLALQLPEWISLHSDIPATVTALAVLVLALSLFQGRPEQVFNRRELASVEFSKINDFPARYDAEVAADRLAYEREVENAHKRNEGGDNGL